jgi:uncharacterized protein YkwD
MESGTSPAVPAPNANRNIMLRVLALSFALLAVVQGPSAAQTDPSASDSHSSVGYDISTKQPNPHSNSAAGGSSNSGEDSAAENELLEAANKSRALAGAPALRMDESLQEAARAHARLMIASDRLEHQFSGELALLERIAQVSTATGALKLDRAGENVAYATCASAANDALMHSPPHRENLLDRGFNAAGFAAIWSKGKLYVVQDFAHEVTSYSAQQTRTIVGEAVAELRQQAGLPELVQLMPPKLDEAACSLAQEGRPNAHLLATAFDNRRVLTYTQSRPETLPQAAWPMLRDPGVRQFAVGSCYARSSTYPTGTYWVAILLY